MTRRSSRAACETFIRNAGSTSSRRISPGWVGSRFNGPRTGSTFVVFVVFVVAMVVAFRSVILLESQLVGVLAFASSPARKAADRSSINAAAVVKKASKPF